MNGLRGLSLLSILYMIGGGYYLLAAALLLFLPWFGDGHTPAWYMALSSSVQGCLFIAVGIGLQRRSYIAWDASMGSSVVFFCTALAALIFSTLYRPNAWVVISGMAVIAALVSVLIIRYLASYRIRQAFSPADLVLPPLGIRLVACYCLLSSVLYLVDVANPDKSPWLASLHSQTAMILIDLGIAGLYALAGRELYGRHRNGLWLALAALTLSLVQLVLFEYHTPSHALPSWIRVIFAATLAAPIGILVWSWIRERNLLT